jgi:hypothetical protein
MRATSLVLLLCLFFYLAVTSHADVIPNGYFPGRSADYVIAPKNGVQASDSFMMFKTAGHYAADSINDTQIADLVAHSMNSGALNGLETVNRSAYPNVDVFNPSQANLLVSIDYLGADSQSELTSVGQAIKIEKTAYPMSTISYLTTIVTGATPSVHGIISSVWKEFDEIIRAYSNEGQSLIGNYADMLSQSTQGKSAVVSISSDAQQATAMCSHQLNLAREPLSNNYCYTWDSTLNKVKAIAAPIEKLSILSKSQIWLAFTHKESTLSKILADAGITIVDVQPTLTRFSFVHNGVTSEFDYNTQEDMTFAAEISMIADLIARLRLGAYKNLAQDSAQDHFSVAISSLRTLANKYGETSSHFTVAVKIVDSVTKTLISEFEKVYDNKTTVEIIFMGKQNIELPSSLNGLVEAQYLPQIVAFETKSEDEVIKAVESALENTQFEVVEQQATDVTYYRTKRSTPDISSSSSPIDLLTITPYQLASFQICLWTPIILTVVVLAITITMINMGTDATTGKDAMVFNAPRSGAVAK